MVYIRHMDSVFHTIRFILLTILIFYLPLYPQLCLVPVSTVDRSVTDDLKLTPIGAYAAPRLERHGIPAHLHTGIDIKRPHWNYIDEPIYPIAAGTVISVRDDGPYAQIIIEHHLPDIGPIWSVYEHIAGISCSLGDSVDPFIHIARFMNRSELEQHGLQFDHLHLEILKQPPHPVFPTSELPDRLFRTYNLICYTEIDLSFYYINPLQFFNHLGSISHGAADGNVNDQDNGD